MVGPSAGVRALGMWLRKLLFSFDGRVGRAPYWLVLLAVLFIDSVAFGAVGGFELFGGDSIAVERKSPFLALLVILPSLWVCLVLTLKSWHDRHKSGPLVFVHLSPAVRLLWT